MINMINTMAMAIATTMAMMMGAMMTRVFGFCCLRIVPMHSDVSCRMLSNITKSSYPKPRKRINQSQAAMFINL